MRLGHSILFFRYDGLNVPYALRVLIDTPVAREESHSRDRRDGLCSPLLRVLVALVDELLRLDVRCKVIRNEVVVTMVHDAVEERREGAGVAKGARVDAVEYGSKSRVELVLLVEVSVAELVDVLGEVAEKEDVVLADLAGNFNLALLV